jgi:hypothetical protein
VRLAKVCRLCNSVRLVNAVKGLPEVPNSCEKRKMRKVAITTAAMEKKSILLPN